MTVNILGTKYHIYHRSPLQDDKLSELDGYCDKTTKVIVVTTEHGELGDFAVYQRKVLRHEILHAFLFESGLHENFSHPEYGHDETYLDWFACQWPKINAVYTKLGITD